MIDGKDPITYQVKSCTEIQNLIFLAFDKFYTNSPSHCICFRTFQLEMLPTVEDSANDHDFCTYPELPTAISTLHTYTCICQIHPIILLPNNWHFWSLFLPSFIFIFILYLSPLPKFWTPQNSSLCIPLSVFPTLYSFLAYSSFSNSSSLLSSVFSVLSTSSLYDSDSPLSILYCILNIWFYSLHIFPAFSYHLTYLVDMSSYLGILL